MSLVKPAKIFVEEADEITFVIEKVIDATEDSIILVVSENAQIFTSMVSLNILYRKATQAEKYLILVTEDSKGLHIAQKAGYIAVHKVSQITNELWEIAVDRQVELARELRNRLKPDEGLSAVGDQQSVETEEIREESEVQQEEDGDISRSETVTQDDQTKSQDASAEEKDEDTDTNDEYSEYKRPRVHPKVITVAGIQILAGGDIRTLNTTQINNSNSEKQPMERSPEKSIPSSFAGRDYSRSIPEKNGFQTFLSSLAFWNKKNPASKPTDTPQKKRTDSDKKTPFNKKKWGIIIAVVITLFLLGSYFLIFQAASVDISVTVAQEDIETSEEIAGDAALEEVDTEALSVPLEKSDEEEVSLQKSGTATGKKLQGEKATGFINIINYTDQEISLPAGTLVTNPSSGLQYVMTDPVTLGAATIDEDSGIDDPSIEVDVPVEAVDIGDLYNINSSTSNTVFTIQGYTGTSEVEGRRFSPFEGGSSEEVTTVSQEDVDKLKNELTEEAETQLREQLSGGGPTGYQFIEESITINEPTVESTPKVGEEVPDDGSFTVSIELTGYGLLVRDRDLEEIANAVVVTSSESDLQVTDVNDLAIVEVTKLQGDKITFTLTSSSTIAQALDTSEIVDLVKGKSFEEAKKALEGNENIEDFKIVYSPFIVPEFARFVPNSESKIDVTVE